MKKIKRVGLIMLVAILVVAGLSGIAYSETTVVTTDRAPYFHRGAGPIASIFYWIGDIVVLPFRLIGNLLS